jgi:lysophospholipase L1-like esterase
MHRVVRVVVAVTLAAAGIVTLVLVPRDTAAAGPASTDTSSARVVTTPARHVPTVAVIGDSYTTAAGLSSAQASAVTLWQTHVAQALGWDLVAVVSDPSGGFVNPGIDGTFADALDARPLPRDVDFVLVQGGFNDGHRDPDSLPPAVAALIDRVHEQAPHAVPIVVGAFQPFEDRLGSPTQLRVARAIGRESAIGDTRYIAGYLCEFEAGPDGVHPSVRGHQQIGQWVVRRLTRGLDNGDRLQRNATGGFYTT